MTRRQEQAEENTTSKRRKGRRGMTLLFVCLAILGVLGIARLLMPWFVRDYVNRTLDRNTMYAGRIGAVEIHLLRGAYSIRNIKLNKTTGNVPVPLLAAKRIDFSVQWNALVHGKVVGRFLMEEPELNF